MSRRPLLDPEVIRRYTQVVPLNRAANVWNKQRSYGEPFAYMPFALGDPVVSGMLRHKWWIGTRAPANGRVDRITFDLDSKGGAAAAVAARDERYAGIRDLFGTNRRPLVYRTPGGGLRVVYRIPTVPLTTIITGLDSGLVADVLRARGLAAVRGEIELFPQAKQAERVPLGRGMPLLDPDTLLPLPHANIGDTFDLDALLGGLDEMERWHAAPYADLLDHLAALPRLEIAKPEKPAPAKATRVVEPRSEPSPLAVTSTAAELFNHGLTAPSTRQEAEWIVGSAMVQNPTDYGLPPTPTKPQIAEGLAVWLAHRHNNQSKDWTRELTRRGDVEATIGAFMDRYLEPNRRTGRDMIDRLLLGGTKSDPSRRPVAEVSDAQASTLLVIAEQHYSEPGVRRYRFECWLFEWLRQVKRIAHRNRRSATGHKDTGKLSMKAENGSVVPATLVEIAAEWMEAWPYGAGETNGRVQYAEFVDALKAAGMMQLRTRYRTANAQTGERGYANQYLVPTTLTANVLVRELEADPRDVERAIAGLTGYGDAPLTLAEAYHALYVTRIGLSRSDLVARYNRASADRVLTIARDVRAGLRAGPDAALVTSEA